MPISISFLTLKVSNLEEAMAFYSNVWGTPLKQVKPGMGMVELQNLRLGLVTNEFIKTEKMLQFLEGGSMASGTLLSVNVDSKSEVDRLLALAADAGARIIQPSVDTSWGSYAAFFDDLDGYHWEVSWHPPRSTA